MWLIRHQQKLPQDFPIDQIIAGLKIVMQCNVFSFGNKYFLQLNGTAMGTPCACAYATIYYSFHEENTIFHKMNPNPPLYYGRLIDDAIVLQEDTPNNWVNFLKQMQTFTDDDGNGLEWESKIPPRNRSIFST